MKVRAAPHELRHAAPELVRSLMHCRLPEWAEAEAKRWAGGLLLLFKLPEWAEAELKTKAGA